MTLKKKPQSNCSTKIESHKIHVICSSLKYYTVCRVCSNGSKWCQKFKFPASFQLFCYLDFILFPTILAFFNPGNIICSQSYKNYSLKYSFLLGVTTNAQKGLWSSAELSNIIYNNNFLDLVKKNKGYGLLK